MSKKVFKYETKERAMGADTKPAFEAVVHVTDGKLSSVWAISNNAGSSNAGYLYMSKWDDDRIIDNDEKLDDALKFLKEFPGAHKNALKYK